MCHAIRALTEHKQRIAPDQLTNAPAYGACGVIPISKKDTPVQAENKHMI